MHVMKHEYLALTTLCNHLIDAGTFLSPREILLHVWSSTDFESNAVETFKCADKTRTTNQPRIPGIWCKPVAMPAQPYKISPIIKPMLRRQLLLCHIEGTNDIIMPLATDYWWQLQSTMRCRAQCPEICFKTGKCFFDHR